MYIITYPQAESAMNMLGFSDLRTRQVGPVESVAQGCYTFVRLPTGDGKSTIFQPPALSFGPGVLSLNFSPLKALQGDQVKKLQEKGIQAHLLNSDLKKAEDRRFLRKP